MAVAKKMRDFVENGSMIRKMFEEGARLKKIHGADKVFDFSLGNPNLPPPEAFKRSLRAVVEADEAELHAYMPNAGLAEARAAIAERASADQGLAVDVVPCGRHLRRGRRPQYSLQGPPRSGRRGPGRARPTSSSTASSPTTTGASSRSVPSASDFSLDLAALEAAMGPRTKIVLVNTPNNPTGRIYRPRLHRWPRAAPRAQEPRARPSHLSRLGRALPQDSLRRGRGAERPGELRELHRGDFLLQGPLAPRRAHRLRGGEPRRRRRSGADGRPGPGQPDPRLRQRAEPHAEGGGANRRRLRRRRPLPPQARPPRERAQTHGLRFQPARGGLLPLPEEPHRRTSRASSVCSRKRTSSSCPARASALQVISA